jgi:hypothetical protein
MYIDANAMRPHLCTVHGMPEGINKNNTPWDSKNERMKELQYHDVSTYLRTWYKGKKTIPP